jgi:hypothetical protein
MVDAWRYLPLHCYLQKFSSETTDISVPLMMIEKYPAALRHPDGLGRLPIHVECQNSCRSPVISECIELYPESLAVADRCDALPLQKLLSNQLSSASDALAMIEAYPVAVKRRNGFGTLPFHIEFQTQRRPSILAKCVELYPESIDQIIFFKFIRKISQRNFSTFISVLSILFTARPMMLYDHHVSRDGIITVDPYIRRKVLNNLLPRQVFTPTHDADYQDLNWQPRYAMMMFLSQIKILQQRLSNKNAVVAMMMGSLIDTSNKTYRTWRCLLLISRIIKSSTLLSTWNLHADVDAEGRAISYDTGYRIFQHEDLGDILLRSILGFL